VRLATAYGSKHLVMWRVALLLLIVELAVYFGLFVRPAWLRGETLCAVLWLVALPLGARLIVALASGFMSRWKGVKLTDAQRLSPIAWLKFFAVEYWHLCIQNLLLIPFRAFFHTQSERGAGPTDGPVLLLQHGYVNNGAVWFFTARALEAKGYRVFTIDQPVFASIDTMSEHLAARIDAVLAATAATQLTLVAHSMGGLVCRAFLRNHDGSKVKQLITLGTPHHGTFHALLASGPNGTQMRLGNPWLAALNQTPVTVPFTSVYSLHDTIIAPQDSSMMPEATNVELHAIGHVSMPSGAAARQALIAALNL
jgi:predicted alpha/beta hydrolase family esterase